MATVAITYKVTNLDEQPVTDEIWRLYALIASAARGELSGTASSGVVFWFLWAFARWPERVDWFPLESQNFGFPSRKHIKQNPIDVFPWPLFIRLTTGAATDCFAIRLNLLTKFTSSKCKNVENK